MALLIDSSVIIALERRGQRLSALAAVTRAEPVALASITASELLVGIFRADTPERRVRREAFVEAILERTPILPFDLRVARTHTQLWSELLAAEQMIGVHDLLIAATALAHGYAVLTENLRDFRRVPGLVVRQPTW
jgi:predicted nucleic acid-binding protein